jgi:hypothetical protein
VKRLWVKRVGRGKLEPEIHSADAGHTYDEPELLPGFSIPLTEIFLQTSGC